MKALPTFLVFYIHILAVDIDGQLLAKQLNISACSKASVQWIRIFTKERKLKKYGIDTLNSKEQEALKEYLINHAADSDLPESAGI